MIAAEDHNENLRGRIIRKLVDPVISSHKTEVGRLCVYFKRFGLKVGILSGQSARLYKYNKSYQELLNIHAEIIKVDGIPDS